MLPSKTFTNSTEFKKYQIWELLDFYQRPCKLDSEKEYQLVTVKRRNEGIVSRGIYKGSNIKTPSQFYIKSGDFLISKRQIVHGACEIVPEEFDDAIVSNEYTISRGKKFLTLTEYFNLLSKTTFMKKHYFLSSYGIDIEKMVFNIEDWKKRFVYIPTIEEQVKVVSFFKKLTEKIVLQQEKIDLLKEQKKGYMQRIFSQELRFKNAHGKEYPSWTCEKFSSLFKSIPTKFFQILNTEINTKGLYNVIDQGQSEIAGFSDEKTKLFIDVPVIIYGDHTTIVKYREEPFIVGADGTKIIKTVSKNSLKYLFFSLCHFNIQAQGYKRHFSLLKDLVLPIPTLEEQNKIASFLDSIDIKIRLEQKKLNQFKKQKQAFMQQMFI